MPRARRRDYSRELCAAAVATVESWAAATAAAADSAAVVAGGGSSGGGGGGRGWRRSMLDTVNSHRREQTTPSHLSSIVDAASGLDAGAHQKRPPGMAVSMMHMKDTTCLAARFGAAAQP